MENFRHKKTGLDERLKAYPKLIERMHDIADELELTLAAGGSLDEAEERVAPKLRHLGCEVLTARAERIAAESSPPTGLGVRRHSKKKSSG